MTFVLFIVLFAFFLPSLFSKRETHDDVSENVKFPIEAEHIRMSNLNGRIKGAVLRGM